MGNIKVISEQCMSSEFEMPYAEYVDLCDNLSTRLKMPFGKLIRTIIREEENVLFSPVALLEALVALVHMTEGDTRAQITENLGLDDNLLNLCGFLEYMATHNLSEYSTCNVATSMWLNELMHVNDESVKALCGKMNTSAYAGKMGSDEFNKTVQKWVDENTGNMLTEEVSDISLDVDTFLALFSTLYVKTSWCHAFDEESTSSGTFFSSTGENVECEYMDKECNCGIYREDTYSAISLELEDDYEMTFVLPTQGNTIEELLDSSSCMDFLLTGKGAVGTYASVHMRIPKFDIKSKLNIKKYMTDMGMLDVFDVTKANFLPIAINMNDLCVSNIEQNTRLTIDEEGIEGASYVEILMYTGCPMSHDDLEEVEFILDRPFIAAVSRYNIPLLVASVGDPTK